MKRMVIKLENLLVDIVGETEVFGIKRTQVREAGNTKAPIRTFFPGALREATSEDESHIIYLYTDDDSGEVHELKLQKDFIHAVTKLLEIGRCTAKTAAAILDSIDKPDTDTNRRQFRAAVAYWIDKGILIVSSSNGYFVASSAEEVEACIVNKERQAKANLRRAAHLRTMDIIASTDRFKQELRVCSC